MGRMIAALIVVAGTMTSALWAAPALAVELRDAELVAGGSPVLLNYTGTVRLEDARLGRLGSPVYVPEPGGLWQLGSGIGLLALLARRRRHRTASRAAGAPERSDPATPRRRMP